jgi:hypothetical protein
MSKITPSYIVFKGEQHNEQKGKEYIRYEHFVMEPLCDFNKCASTWAQCC